MGLSPGAVCAAAPASPPNASENRTGSGSSVAPAMSEAGEVPRRQAKAEPTTTSSRASLSSSSLPTRCAARATRP